MLLETGLTGLERAFRTLSDLRLLETPPWRWAFEPYGIPDYGLLYMLCDEVAGAILAVVVILKDGFFF